MDVNFMNFQKSRKAFFFTGAVAILLVLLIASTMTWVAVSNARAERAPIITQGQQVQNLKQSIMSYQRVLQVASEMALYKTNQKVFDDPDDDKLFECLYPDVYCYNHDPDNPQPDPNNPPQYYTKEACCNQPSYCSGHNPLCDLRKAYLDTDPSDPGYIDPFPTVLYDEDIFDNVVKYDFCSRVGGRLAQWGLKIMELGDEMGLDVVFKIGSANPNDATCWLEMSDGDDSVNLDYKTVRVTYNGAYTIKDKATGQVLSTGDLPGVAYVDINGFDDPLVYFKTWEYDLPDSTTPGVVQPILFNEGMSTLSEVQVTESNSLVAQGIRGKGWFYGKTVNFWDAIANPGDPAYNACRGTNDPADSFPKCIGVIEPGLVPTPAQIRSFGAIIIVGIYVEQENMLKPKVSCSDYQAGAPSDLFYDSTWCIDCLRFVQLLPLSAPSIDTNADNCFYVMPDGFTPDLSKPIGGTLGAQGNFYDIPFIQVCSDTVYMGYQLGCPSDETYSINDFFKTNGDGKYMLLSDQFWRNTINWKSSYSKMLIDIEKLRAASMCGFYVQNDHAPNFLQRMTKEWVYVRETLTPGTGIESFLIGEWINNVNFAGDAVFSSVDHILSRAPPLDAEKVKGMPGCIDYNTCSYKSYTAGPNSPFGHFALDDFTSALEPSFFNHLADYDPFSVINCGNRANCECIDWQLVLGVYVSVPCPP